MRNEWLAYVVVILLSAAAAVAIAGVPSSEAVEPTIIVTTTEAPPPTTVPETTAPPATDPPETSAPTTEPATTTTEAATTTEVPAELPDRSELVVAVANGSGVGGMAQATADRRETLGYTDIELLNGDSVVAATVVFHADGLEAAAARLAADLELDEPAFLPITLAPGLDGPTDGIELLVYAGSDQT